jgi:hypothetical protein
LEFCLRVTQHRLINFIDRQEATVEVRQSNSHSGIFEDRPSLLLALLEGLFRAFPVLKQEQFANALRLGQWQREKAKPTFADNAHRKAPFSEKLVRLSWRCRSAGTRPTFSPSQPA